MRKEEAAFARIKREDQALQLLSCLGCFFFLSLRYLAEARLARRKQGRKTGSTQERWIGQN